MNFRFEYEVARMNREKLYKFPYLDGEYLLAFLDGIWLMNEYDYRLEQITERCWVNAHVYRGEQNV